MIVDRVEASTKFCVHLVAPFFLGQGAKCQTSNCMAWRWVSEPDGINKLGYCGLAGKPSDVIYDEMRQAVKSFKETLDHGN